MTLAAFSESLQQAAPSPHLRPALLALWWTGKRDWDTAHDIAQQHEGDPACDWVHAHLHRREGDAENAAYWYRRAGKPMATGKLDEEWSDIAQKLLLSPSP